MRSGWWIDAIQTVWEKSDGSTKTSPRRGGKGGGSNEFVLQAGEYITKVSGTYGTYVGSLTFHTNNKRTSPTYGLAKGNGSGKTFELKAPKGSAIVGFYGRSGDYLDSLGIITRSIQTLKKHLKASPAEPPTGTVWLFEHVDFKGKRKVLSKDNKSLPKQFNDTVSSLKVGPHTIVTLFADKDFKGSSKTFSKSVKNLKKNHNFNDILSSVIIARKLQSTVGGTGGKHFQDIPNNLVRISKIKVRSGWWIDAIQTVWEKSDGSTKTSPRRGGKGGGSNEFVLQAGEYITKVSGTYGTYVGSLTFHTNNKRTSPTYGLAKGNGSGKTFELKAPKGSAIVGFYGRSGDYLDSLGIITRSIQ